MSYQSFLSDIINSKYYKQEEINDLSNTLQRNSGLKISYLKLSSAQIRLQCPHKITHNCQFFYAFTKVINQDQNIKYELVKCISNHSNFCQLFRKYPQLRKCSTSDEKQIKQSFNQLLYDNNCPTVTNLNSRKQNSPKITLTKQLKTKKLNQKNQKLYSEQQLSLLKKELQFQSKGLLSRSTQFNSESNIVKKIRFHCKYEQDCPYLAVLQSISQKQEQKESQKANFSLHVVNNSHLNSCVLQDQILCYNRNTMKIDRQIQLLKNIIQNNQKDTKPKDILRKLAQQLHISQDFIYEGLIKKINKRAIKKYFDNCVAKVRSKIQNKLKIQQVVGYVQVINVIKDNKRQKIRIKNQEQFIYKTRKNNINNINNNQQIRENNLQIKTIDKNQFIREKQHKISNNYSKINLFKEQFGNSNQLSLIKLQEAQ